MLGSLHFNRSKRARKMRDPIFHLPSVAYCADELNLPANYFSDLIKKETGVSAQEYIPYEVINVAKEQIFDMDRSIS